MAQLGQCAEMKRYFLFGLIALLLLREQQVHAQALPVAPAANFVMNRAVAGVITRAAVARGFAANDPRIAATMAGVGSSLTVVNVASTIAGVGLAVAGAPVWLTIAGGLSDATLAQIANNAWQTAAAQPGYTGLPYVMTSPVTASDVAAWRPTASPTDVPTIDDLTRPASNVGTSTVTISTTVQPSSTTNPTPTPTPTPTTSSNVSVVNTPNVNVVNKVSVDLGTDPSVSSPILEATPTAQMILNPLLNLFPSLRSFVVPSHSAECPKPSIALFDRSLVMDGHCTLLESIRPTLYAVMAFIWVLIALFIVLAA